MKKTNSNRLRRREPYHYDATGAQYIACIETALQHGQSIPVHVLQVIYHMLLPYMVDEKSVHSGHLNPNSPAGRSNSNAASECSILKRRIIQWTIMALFV